MWIIFWQKLKCEIFPLVDCCGLGLGRLGVVVKTPRVYRQTIWWGCCICYWWCCTCLVSVHSLYISWDYLSRRRTGKGRGGGWHHICILTFRHSDTSTIRRILFCWVCKIFCSPGRSDYVKRSNLSRQTDLIRGNVYYVSCNVKLANLTNHVTVGQSHIPWRPTITTRQGYSWYKYWARGCSLLYWEEMHCPVLSPALIPLVEKCIKILFSAYFWVNCRNKWRDSPWLWPIL